MAFDPSQPTGFDLSKLDLNYWRKNKPTGLIGEIIDFSLASAIYPVEEISLTAALGFLAGIVGRSYTVRGTGLSLYIILVAKSGRGKEAISKTMGYLTSAMVKHGPRMGGDDVQFGDPLYKQAYKIFGPGDWASGQGLLRYFTEEHPCFVSVFGECSHKLRAICAPDANSADSKLKMLILDLWGKNSLGGWLKASVYSDKTRDTKEVQFPAITIVAESTLKKFYDVIGDTSLIDDGFLPRFLIIEYTGKRVYEQEYRDIHRRKIWLNALENCGGEFNNRRPKATAPLSSIT